MEKLFDTQGQMLGYLQANSAGHLQIFDPMGNRLGVYYPDTNKTFNNNAQQIGVGNLLTTLLR